MPVEVLFLGIVADPEETHAVWYGMLNIFGIFDLSVQTDAEKVNYVLKKHYFWFGEVAVAAALAAMFAIPLGFFLAGRAEITLAFIGATVLFPATLHVPAEADPVWYENGRGHCN